MTVRQLVDNLTNAIVQELNKIGCTNPDGAYIENSLTCAIACILLKAGYTERQIVNYFARALVLLKSNEKIDFTQEITNKE